MQGECYTPSNIQRKREVVPKSNCRPIHRFRIANSSLEFPCRHWAYNTLTETHTESRMR
ncbi:hypothetical protein PM082_004530 [Marasmius tenuissimus]|nr:hypothetical protein PM082_004530 [Marasmius tenuissimus]